MTRRLRQTTCAVLVIVLGGIIGALFTLTEAVITATDWLMDVGELDVEDPRGPV